MTLVYLLLKFVNLNKFVRLVKHSVKPTFITQKSTQIYSVDLIKKYLNECKKNVNILSISIILLTL